MHNSIKRIRQLDQLMLAIPHQTISNNQTLSINKIPGLHNTFRLGIDRSSNNDSIKTTTPIGRQSIADKSNEKFGQHNRLSLSSSHHSNKLSNMAATNTSFCSVTSVMCTLSTLFAILYISSTCDAQHQSSNRKCLRMQSIIYPYASM